MCIKLSFCIPTYNRRKTLEETLQSILSQISLAKEEIEVIVCDNHSCDGTQARVIQLQKLYPFLRYHRSQKTVPCGDNLLKAVSLARGEYCWLMTDDDRVEPGGLEHVFALLESYPQLTGLSVNVEGYDRELKRKKKIHYSHHLQKLHLFTNAEEIFTSLGAWMGFWSAHIVRRVSWQKASLREHHLQFTGYHHLSIMLEMAHKAPYWLFTEKKCVGYRADHESFHQEYGRVKRFAIDVAAYTCVGKDLFSKRAIRAVNQVVIKKLLFWQLVRVKCEKHSWKMCSELLTLCYSYYRRYVACWMLLIPLLFVPRWCMLCIQRWYRRWKNL